MIDWAAVQVLVWDVDDTLYLERDYVRSGFAAVGGHVATTRGVAGLGEALWGLFEQGVRGNTFNLALTAVGLADDPGTIGELVAVYRAHKPQIALLDDAVALLQRFPGPQAVITDGPANSQHNKVQALELARWCSPVVVTADLGPGKGKPAPEAYITVERATGRSGAALVYIADNPTKDFVTPRARGWQSLRLRREGGLHAALTSGDDVDAEAADLSWVAL